MRNASGRPCLHLWAALIEDTFLNWRVETLVGFGQQKYVADGSFLLEI